MSMDSRLGYWIDDIPYMWISPLNDTSIPSASINEWWLYSGRVYFVPLSRIESFNDRIQKSGACSGYVKNYFQSTYLPPSYYNTSFRMNGEEYDSSTSHYESVDEMYEDLKINAEKLGTFTILPDKYKDIACGLKLNTPYRITDLICFNLNSSNFSQFLKGRKCTTLSFSISQNLVRVASQRIFLDPLKSLLEPISNSIDAYREKRGEDGSSIGKFGMGFFSLLWWLVDEKDFIEIESTYVDNSASSEKWCTWSCIIKYNASSGYTFSLTSAVTSPKKKNPGIFLSLYIHNKQKRDLLELKSFEEFIKKSFWLIKDVHIYFNKIKLQTMVESTSPDSIYITVATKKGIQSILTYRDNANGMNLITLLSKLLVPSISSKTVDSFSKRELKRTNLTNVLLNSAEKLYNTFFLAVGDVIIYSNHSTNPKKEKTYTFVLSLPSLTPLPISRDDVILENPVFYEKAKEELEILAEKTLSIPNAFSALMERLKDYSYYANDIYIYNLIEYLDSYIQNKKDVVLVPQKYGEFYNKNIAKLLHSEITFVESVLVDYEKIKDLVLPLLKKIELSRIRKKIYIVPDMNTNMESGGLIDILFISSSFVENKNQNEIEESIILSSRLSVFETYDEGDNEEIKKKMKKYWLYSQHMLYYHYYEEPIPVLYGRIEVDFHYIHNNYLIPLFQYDTSIKENGKIKRSLSHLKKNANDDYQPIKAMMYYLWKNYVKIFYDIFASFHFPLSVIIFVCTAIIESYFISSDLEFVESVCFAYYNFLLQFKSRDIIISNSNSERISGYCYIKNDFNHVLEIGNNGYDMFYISFPKFMKIHTKEEKKYMMNSLSFFLNCYLNDQNGYVVFSNFFDGTFLRLDANYVKKFDEDGNPNIDEELAHYLKEFLFQQNYIYAYYMKIIIRKIRFHPNFQKEMHIPFVFSELSQKYDMGYLASNYELLIRYNVYKAFDVICDNIINSFLLFVQIDTKNTYQKIIEFPEQRIHSQFTALQIINYIFENEVSEKNVEWFKDISSFVPKHQAKFQSLEIAINEGTTKSFMDAVITELVQNSMDAIRKINSGGSIYLTIGNIFAGGERTEGNNYGICVRDEIGIPIKGIFSILIPFLSTKTEKDATSTGEMGTGFMNVYRQPYAKKVLIKTKCPTDGVVYFIETIVHKKEKRVVDVMYKVFTVQDSSFKGTEIAILLDNNENTESNEITSILSQGQLFSQKYLPYIPIPVYVNEKNIHFEKTDKNILLKTKYCSFSTISSNASSIFLTNGVPFGLLSDYIMNHPQMKKMVWLQYFGTTGMLVDLHKNAYTPVQSRKKIQFSKEYADSFDMALQKACLIMVGRRVLENLNYWVVVKDFMEGSSYNGDALQVLPDSSYNKNEYNEMFKTPIYLEGYKVIENQKQTRKTKSRRIIVSDETEDDPILYFRLIEILHLIVYSDLIWKKTSKKNPFFYFNIGKQSFLDLVKNTIMKKEYFAGKNIPMKKKEEIWKCISDPAIQILLYGWLSNKNIERDFPDDAEQTKKVKKAKKEIPKDIMPFIRDMVKQVWMEGKRQWSSGLFNGCDFSRPPPTIDYGEKKGTLGYYEPSKHRIIIDAHKLELENINESIQTLKKIKSPIESALFIKKSTEFGNLLNLSDITPSTLVHELCHAFFGEKHVDIEKGTGFHGMKSYETRTSTDHEFTKHTHTFYTIAIKLFLHLFQNYKNPYT